MRAGLYKGWLPTLFVGNLLQASWGSRCWAVRAGFIARLANRRTAGQPLAAQLPPSLLQLLHPPQHSQPSSAQSSPTLVTFLRAEQDGGDCGGGAHRHRLRAHDGGGPQVRPALLRPLPQHIPGGVCAVSWLGLLGCGLRLGQGGAGQREEGGSQGIRFLGAACMQSKAGPAEPTCEPVVYRLP